MSAASLRLSGKCGIFGCGSSRKKAIFSGVKFDFFAIETNGGASAIGPLLVAIDDVTGY
jgi:hypothetical protein